MSKVLSKTTSVSLGKTGFSLIEASTFSFKNENASSHSFLFPIIL